MKQIVGVFATALLLAGCSSPETGSDNDTSPAPAADPQVKSAPGTPVGSALVLKNYFFNMQDEYCDDWSLTGGTSEHAGYGECLDQDTYFWLFDDEQQRDALLPEIQEKGVPLLVSDEWVIASPLDLTDMKEEYGGAINMP